MEAVKNSKENLKEVSIIVENCFRGYALTSCFTRSMGNVLPIWDETTDHSPVIFLTAAQPCLGKSHTVIISHQQ